MMHNHNIIVCIRDLSVGRSCREYNHSKADLISNAQVLLPFEAEYGIAFKVMDGSRYRMELYIDGAEVTKDLIISGDGTIERFVETNKKFKFVSANHPSVSDPTSSENGIVEVKLFRERTPIRVVPQYVPTYNPRPRPYDPYNTVKGIRGTVGTPGLMGQVGPQSYAYPADCDSVRGLGFGNLISEASLSCDTNVAMPCSASLGLAGATVEGGSSNQTFGSTTWAGDAGEPLVFIFHLRGKVETAPVLQAKRAIECPYCHSFNQETAKFCSECGAKFIRG